MTPLRERRLALGLGQEVLARAAGVSRQALSALEAGRALPSLANALALARALGTTVEALFGDSDAEALGPGEWGGIVPPDGRVRWSRIAGRLVLRPARPDEDLDAVVAFDNGVPRRLVPLPGAADPDSTVWLGGCDPALPLLARAIERVAPHLHAAAVPLTTGEARAALENGQIHVASVHTGADAAAFDANSLSYVVWREGFVLAPGLERERLADTRLRWALRPPGATAHTLLEAAVPGASERGGPLLGGHWAVAEAVRSGQADAGVAVEAAAVAFGLPFVPLAEERVRLLVHPAAVEVRSALVRALGDERLWARLATLAGYRRATDEE